MIWYFYNLINYQKGIRQLLGYCHGRWYATHTWLIWCGFSMRIKWCGTQEELPDQRILPRNRCLSSLFLHCESRVIREYKEKGNFNFFSYIYIVIEIINVNNTRFAILQIFSNWQWVPEIKKYKSGTPFLLVGTQMDLRNDQQTIQKLAKNKQKPITTEQGDSMAKQLKAVKFVECSALTQVRYQIVWAYNIKLKNYILLNIL